MHRLPQAVLAGAAVMTLAASALAPGFAAGERSGRFVMSPSSDGVVRLDTETGAVSLCKGREGAWSCAPVAETDTAQREEIARLAAENAALKSEVARLSGAPVPAPSAPDGSIDGGRPGGGAPALRLPSEEDVDKALDYITRMVRKFQSKLKELEGDPKPGAPL